MRQNIFNKAHRPLKLALLSTCIGLSEKENVNLEEASEAVKMVEEVLRVFKEQVKYEASYILPLVFEYEPAIWNMYTTEHYKAANLAHNLESLIRSYHKSENEDDKLGALDAICHAYNEFVLFNYHHMDDEEEVLNEILWRYYNDNFIGHVQDEMNVSQAKVYRAKNTRVFQPATAA